MFDLRNLQLRTNFDLSPGLQINSIIQFNKEFDTIESFNPNFDELYLEAYGFHRSEFGKLSASLKNRITLFIKQILIKINYKSSLSFLIKSDNI